MSYIRSLFFNTTEVVVKDSISTPAAGGIAVTVLKDDILSCVFRFLSDKDLQATCSVCKPWNVSVIKYVKNRELAIISKIIELLKIKLPSKYKVSSRFEKKSEDIEKLIRKNKVLECVDLQPFKNAKNLKEIKVQLLNVNSKLEKFLEHVKEDDLIKMIESSIEDKTPSYIIDILNFGRISEQFYDVKTVKELGILLNKLLDYKSYDKAIEVSKKLYCSTAASIHLSEEFCKRGEYVSAFKIFHSLSGISDKEVVIQTIYDALVRTLKKVEAEQVMIKYSYFLRH